MVTPIATKLPYKPGHPLIIYVLYSETDAILLLLEVWCCVGHGDIQLVLTVKPLTLEWTSQLIISEGMQGL